MSGQGDQAVSHTDIPEESWIDRRLPPGLRPYARLARWDRRIGIWLLLFPCWWSLVLATPNGAMPNLALAFLLFAGAVIMRGAGCTINDILDREIDAKVERTRGRPLPSGQITVRQALGFLALQLGLGLAILLILPPLAWAIGAVAVVMILLYPLAKRVTDWPQAVLGATFNLGVLISWVAVTGTLAPAAYALYLAGIAWTLGYDTIYAHQDRRDDARIGVRSTARLFGDASRDCVLGFYVAFSGLLLLAGLLDGLGPDFLVAVMIVSGHLAWQVMTWKIDDPADCLGKFKSNALTGWMVLLAILAGHVDNLF